MTVAAARPGGAPRPTTERTRTDEVTGLRPIVRFQRALAPTTTSYMATAESSKHMYEFQGEPWFFFKLNGVWYHSRLYELNWLE